MWVLVFYTEWVSANEGGAPEQAGWRGSIGCVVGRRQLSVREITQWTILQALKSRLVAGILFFRSFSQISSKPRFYKALSLISDRKFPF